jgi:hypothetical protein
MFPCRASSYCTDNMWVLPGLSDSVRTSFSATVRSEMLVCFKLSPCADVDALGVSSAWAPSAAMCKDTGSQFSGRSAYPAEVIILEIKQTRTKDTFIHLTDIEEEANAHVSAEHASTSKFHTFGYLFLVIACWGGGASMVAGANTLGGEAYTWKACAFALALGYVKSACKLVGHTLFCY